MSLSRVGDLAHARTRGYRRRVDAALAEIESFIAAHDGRCFVGVSWGKDSTVVLDLVMRVAPATPVIHYRWPDVMRPSGLDQVRDQLIERYGMVVLTPVWSEDDHAMVSGLGRPCREEPSHPPYVEISLDGEPTAWYRTGRPFLVPENDAEREALADVWADDATRFRSCVRALGCSGSIIGLRGDESHGRMMHLATRGLRWESREWGIETCAPIGRWSSADVWAYHADRDLPHAPHYDRSPRGRDRERSEMTFSYISHIWWRGMSSGWARADPDLWQRLTAAWPEIADW